MDLKLGPHEMKQLARNLRAMYGKDFDRKMAESESLERAARLCGHANWDTAAAQASTLPQARASTSLTPEEQLAQIIAFTTGIRSGMRYSDILQRLQEQGHAKAAAGWRQTSYDPYSGRLDIGAVLRATGLFDDTVLLVATMCGDCGDLNFGPVISYLETMVQRK